MIEIIIQDTTEQTDILGIEILLVDAAFRIRSAGSGGGSRASSLSGGDSREGHGSAVESEGHSSGSGGSRTSRYSGSDSEGWATSSRA